MLNLAKNPHVRLTMIAAMIVALAFAAIAVPARAQSVGNGYVKSLTLSSAPANGLHYAAGDVVSVDAAFNKNVRVARENSDATQRMLIRLNGDDRFADYAGRVGDDGVHRFSYAVTAADAETSAGLFNLYNFIMWLLAPFTFIWGQPIADSQVEAVEIQTVDSVFIPVGEECEARINDDPNNALDAAVVSPYTCNYYAVSADISGLSLN